MLTKYASSSNFFIVSLTAIIRLSSANSMIQGIANLQLIVGLLMVIQNLEILMILYFKILQPIQQEILRLKQQIKDQNKLEITRLQIWFN